MSFAITLIHKQKLFYINTLVCVKANPAAGAVVRALHFGRDGAPGLRWAAGAGRAQQPECGLLKPVTPQARPPQSQTGLPARLEHGLSAAGGRATPPPAGRLPWASRAAAQRHLKIVINNRTEVSYNRKLSTTGQRLAISG